MKRITNTQYLKKGTKTNVGKVVAIHDSKSFQAEDGFSYHLDETEVFEDITRIQFTLQALMKAKELKISNGVIECPKCNGRLYILTASNGHTMGNCKTENCLSWVE